MIKPETETLIDDILSRGVAECIDPDGSFRKKLIGKAEGSYTKDIVIKFGVDPTRPDIHLGHAVVLRTLRKLQDLGCKIIFLIGDFTARIGDPTGKSKVRPEIEQAEVEKNLKTYLDQVGKILRTDDAVFSWIRNSDWFYSVTDLLAPKSVSIKYGVAAINPNSFVGKAVYFEETRMQKKNLKHGEIFNVSLLNLLQVLRRLTHSRLIERDMFQDRMKKSEELYLHEMLYPIIQGIDSNLIAKIYGSCDLEVGGSDQTFNMLMGRDVMKNDGQEPQAVMAFELLVGTDGKEKMSKSLDNYIAISDTPADIYGKTMSIPDNAIINYFTLATYESLGAIKNMETALSNGVNPRDLKMKLARQLVAIYHGEKTAADAEKNFVDTFSKGGISKDAKEVVVATGALLVDVLLKEGVIESKSEFRRLQEAGAISLNGQKLDANASAVLTESSDVKVGKHRFLKIHVS